MLGRLAAVAVTRSRTIAAPAERIWEVIGDPEHQPRWWPGVERVEGVAEGHFTQVMRTRRGRPVRIDFSVVASDAPGHAVWRQDLVGSPFARVLEASELELTLAPDAAGATTVTVTQRQRLRGSSRTGGFMLRRATRRRLDEALMGLAGVTEGA